MWLDVACIPKLSVRIPSLTQHPHLNTHFSTSQFYQLFTFSQVSLQNYFFVGLPNGISLEAGPVLRQYGTFRIAWSENGVSLQTSLENDSTLNQRCRFARDFSPLLT